MWHTTVPDVLDSKSPCRFSHVFCLFPNSDNNTNHKSLSAGLPDKSIAFLTFYGNSAIFV